jgi:hypothetical protein
LKEYSKAILCFKKTLQLAWHIDGLVLEVGAYENLSNQYYYLGDMERSKYYHDRAVRGKLEAKFSIVRTMSDTHAAKKFRVC